MKGSANNRNIFCLGMTLDFSAMLKVKIKKEAAVRQMIENILNDLIGRASTLVANHLCTMKHKIPEYIPKDKAMKFYHIR
jgi:hypothetical protein